MNRLPKAIILLVAILIVSRLWLSAAEAQEENDWSPPFRLSTGQGDSTEATLVSDSYGYVHAFWTEALDDQRTLLLYARFDGHNWTVPNDIYVSRPFISIKEVAAAIDENGRLYVMWSEGDNGPAYYTSAPVHDALSAHDWEEPYRVLIPASSVKLHIDSKGVFHVLYTRVTDERGVYYVHSEDQGISWSDPLWLDPDILLDHMPSNLRFVMDEEDGLHATWFYFSTDSSSGDWVRYTHSLDGGKTWPLPFTIDRLEENEVAAGEELSAAGPLVAVQGQTVHVIWAGGTLHYRHHRYSEDRGQTWSRPVRVFGGLNGGAGDGITVDGSGRLHLFFQVRFPQGIYHAIWDQDHWIGPSLIYLIRYAGEDDFGGRIHAHNTLPAVRAGNQLILTLTDSPSEVKQRLFFMQYTLEDVPMSPIEPPPTPTATPVPEASSTPALPPATQVPSFDTGALPPAAVPGPDKAIWSGAGPALLLVFSAIVFRLLKGARIR